MCVSFSLLCALLCVPNIAHAGFFEWLDNATTYNEDQRRPLRPQILPEGPPAPLLYDTRGAERWNQYHKKDLVAVPYMDGSGTMVMRPRSAQQGMLHGYVYDQTGKPVLGPNGQPITGYELMQRRAALNKVRQTEGKLYIGEPEHFPSNANIGVGVKTRIGAPIEDWRDPQNGLQFNPQPGDYDYAGQNQAQYDGLNSYTTLPRGGQNHGKVGLRPRGTGGNGNFNQHFPDHYVVQKGDTLSEISEQDQIYGDWKLWPLIYDANRSQIKHPDEIYPKQRFTVPRDYTVDQADDARQHALPAYDALINRR